MRMGCWLRCSSGMSRKPYPSDLTDALGGIGSLVAARHPERPSQDHRPALWSTASCTLRPAYPGVWCPRLAALGHSLVVLPSGGTSGSGPAPGTGGGSLAGPGSGSCGTGGYAQRGIIDSQHHWQPVGEDHRKRGPRGYDAGKRVTGRKHAHRGGHHVTAGGGGSSRQHSDRAPPKLVLETVGAVPPVAGDLGRCWLRGPTGVVGLGHRWLDADRSQAHPTATTSRCCPGMVVERTLAWLRSDG